MVDGYSKQPIFYEGTTRKRLLQKYSGNSFVSSSGIYTSSLTRSLSTILYTDAPSAINVSSGPNDEFTGAS